MKVLFQTRSDYRKNPAGDTVQVLATAQSLQKLGVKVYISLDPNVRLDGYDLVHIFNATRAADCSRYLENAKKQHKPIALSPIYWNMDKYLEQRSKKTAALSNWESLQPWRRQLIADCDLLLPNGQAELDIIHQDFQVFPTSVIIPNGFPEEYIGIDERFFRAQCPDLPRTFVFCAARISARKNQVWLARSCRELGLTLVLAGPVNDPKYFEELSAYPNVVYLGTLQGQLLASAYAASSVHALPSWFETPGLSSLEAAACGTVVLSTDQGCTRDYFEDMAVYANPFNEDSLIPALQKALATAPEPLRKHVRSHFCWTQIGQQTLAAYQSLLADHTP